MKVKELIEFLETQPQDLPVIYELHSEYTLLEKDFIEVGKQQPARADGRVHASWGDKGLATVEYLIFPGN